MGQGGLRPDHQRILRADRMQSGARLVRRARRLARRRHRQAGARPRRGGDRPRRAGAETRRGRADRGAAARSGDVPAILGQARGDARQVRRRLDDHRRSGDDGRGRLFLLRRPRRRRHHFGRLPHRPRRDRGLPDPSSSGGACRCGRQARPGPHRDRQGVHRVEKRARGVRLRSPPRFRASCGRGSPRTNIRARSPSSSRCR